MNISSRSVWFVWWVWCWLNGRGFALPRSRGSGEVAVSGKGGPAGEPSCEELKAMWRFSKRQSRAAEITNEIPMYRDPFSNNVWEPYYATSRSMGGMRMGVKHPKNQVYGRMYFNPPPLRIHDQAERNRVFEELTKMYGTQQRQTHPPKQMTAFRLSGGRHLQLGYPPQSGSFQHLKELIRTERARELQEQRMAEEVAARAAALKELAGSHRNQANYHDISNYNYDIDGRENQRGEAYMGRYMEYPDLLLPPRHDPSEDYGYPRERSRSSLFDASSYNVDDFDGLML